ncbi:MAG: RdgB/HAM1 family non-canonical purine NTP pyrophosphatase [Lachnospiraceae bacterium]|nr:RdgB/HAM1 family non-canonical purine NTP pyrophosphatase [Lachnospiraceae bacterium]
MKIIFATGNENKVKEIRKILDDPDITIMTMKEAGCVCDPDENGADFAENALIKCRALAALLPDRTPDTVIMSDDSGLCIDALGGEPGVHSARFMGHETSYDIKNRELIRRLEGIEGDQRSARFECAAAAVLSDGSELVCTGTMEGLIAQEPAGANGFGYDPILYLPQYGCTSAEISEEEKNSISHRGEALRGLRLLLREKGL